MGVGPRKRVNKLEAEPLFRESLGGRRNVLGVSWFSLQTRWGTDFLVHGPEGVNMILQEVQTCVAEGNIKLPIKHVEVP